MKEEALERLMMHITSCEVLAKTSIVEYAEQHLTENGDKTLLTMCVSMGIASASLAATTDGLQQGASPDEAKIVLGIYQRTVQEELLKLLKAVHDAEERRKNK